MGATIAKDSIDIGIIVKDADRSLAFYRDTLGLPFEGSLDMGGGTTMHRLKAGTTVVKLLAMATPPPAEAPPGGIRGAYGYRYWTITVSNIQELVAAVENAGYKVVTPVREIRAGVTIAIVEDPDGNWVEFLTNS
jgi:catechol 2,3-dioxygenase-like lactoylglutathione lyase family enzyme